MQDRHVKHNTCLEAPAALKGWTSLRSYTHGPAAGGAPPLQQAPRAPAEDGHNMGCAARRAQKLDPIWDPKCGPQIWGPKLWAQNWAQIWDPNLGPNLGPKSGPKSGSKIGSRIWAPLFQGPKKWAPYFGAQFGTP